MEIEGMIVEVFLTRSGTSEKGAWMSQDYLLETTRSGYTSRMLFTVYGGDRIQRFAVKKGMTVNVSFTVEAKEYKGRWYNQVRAFDVRERREEAPVAKAEVNDQNPFDAPPKEGVFEGL